MCHRQLTKLEYDPTVPLRELQLIVLSPYTELLKAADSPQLCPTHFPSPQWALLSMAPSLAAPLRGQRNSLPKGGASMAPLRDGEWSSSRSCRL
jgi:hypothetical protein